MPPTPELKATLSLPQTAFPMKANLPQNEPLRLKKWDEMALYEAIRQACEGRPVYLLHDGPPYANGPIHLGHALNKGLKDFVVKSKTMDGYDAPFIPGFDCHGLPIEIKVDEQLGRKKLEMPAPSVLSACRAYAQKYVDLQTSQFKRIGCLGRWDDPYRTMTRPYEARTLEAFYGFFEKGFVFRGLKPVYWCAHDRTALAEAEVEYANHQSPSVYVRYRLTSNELINKLREMAAGSIEQQCIDIFEDNSPEIHTIIWTTTPWTLPASMAVCFHPDFDYIAVEVVTKGNCCPQRAIYIVAEALLPKVAEACGFRAPDFPQESDPVGWREVCKFKGALLEQAVFQHPFLDRAVRGVLADYVTADTGTGAVHTAPAHGADDFYTGQRYGIDPTCRVDAAGRVHTEEAAWTQPTPPPYEGKKVEEANPLVIALLEERGALLAKAPLDHSYPHCWRCHHPVIYRATEQWFISLDTQVEEGKSYRQKAIEEIDKVTWDPSWGKERITNMIATRPDWCISRQRIWGVPIAVFLCEKCNEPHRDLELNRKIVGLVEEQGAEAWHTTPLESLLPAGTQCAKCGHAEFRKEMDILDVWFDSGASWLAVCESDPALAARYKDFQQGGQTKVLYLEGGDQHRGWFHSSLLASVALRGRAPYTNVATAGWTLDEQGRAMSKSLGNGVDPVDIANRMGGEIVRLWVASVDFREDMAASENLMSRCADIYRKLRNTFRFLLGNLHGFNPATDSVPEFYLQHVDRYMLARTRELTEKVLGWYESFEFHKIYHAINEFCIADLSAFYLDAIKDRMYTFAPASEERRAAQTTLWKIAEALVRLVAPILSFTADEVWEHLPQVEGREVSVHLALFPKPSDIYSEPPAPLLADWKVMFEFRTEVLKMLEAERQKKVIGKALEAEVHILTRGELLEMLVRYMVDLKEFLNVSQVHLAAAKARNGLDELMNEANITLTSLKTGATAKVDIRPAEGTKCARCWNVLPDVTNYGVWQNICPRCAQALELMNIAPPQEAE